MMRFIRDLAERVRYLISTAREDAGLRDEMAYHVDQDVAYYEKQGMRRHDAIRAANLKFGSADRFAAETRDASGVGGLLDLLHDIRHALRALLRTPAFSIATVITLGIGIGAATVVFSIADRLVYRPIPGVRDESTLALIHFEEDVSNIAWLSVPNFRDVRKAVPALSSYTAYDPINLQVAAQGVRAESLNGQIVAGDFFGTLGMRPYRGRFFTAAELEGNGETHLAVVSSDFYARTFGKAWRGGNRIVVNAVPYTVIGIAPDGFSGPVRMDASEMWLPAVNYAELRHASPDRFNINDRAFDFLRHSIGRLAPGATFDAAKQQIAAVMANLIKSYPEANEKLTASKPAVYPGLGLMPEDREAAARTLKILLIIAALALAVSCANVANLLLFRALQMRGENGVRRALGASTLRILQHNASQGIVTAALASLCGIALATLMMRYIRDTGLPGIGELTNVAIDGRVMLFAVVLGIGTSIIFAILPTAFLTSTRLGEVLNAATRSDTPGLVWVRRTLVVAQVTLAAALVVPAILLARTVRNLTDVDVGFDTAGISMYGLSTDPQGYDEAKIAAFRREVRERLKRTKGIDAVAITGSAPMSGASHVGSYKGPLQSADGPPASTAVVSVSSEYFSALRIPVVRGRVFNATEDNAILTEMTDGVILNRAAARLMFGDVDPVGRIVTSGRSKPSPHPVIGVVADTRAFDLRTAPRPVVYRPMSEDYFVGFNLVVRSALPPEKAERVVSDVVASIDPGLPFFRVETVSEAWNRAIRTERLFAKLATLLAGLAAGLATVGLYGLMAYAVARRHREIGIRMALGASTTSIVGRVTAETVIFAVAGGSIGLWLGLLTSRLVANMTFGVATTDTWIYLLTSGLFACIAVAASILPARAAALVHPAVALRSE